MISKGLVDAFIKFFPNDNVQYDAAEGAIAMWMAGKGQMSADLVTSSPIWAPVVAAYVDANQAYQLVGEVPVPTPAE